MFSTILGILVCYDMIWCGMVWYGMVWYGMVWVRYGMVGYGLVRREGTCQLWTFFVLTQHVGGGEGGSQARGLVG